ncbi:hypothetical protein FO519_003242 [Halicephalobus sp. NKZ332]|nr:hypothetical protein FO519_003242 [Halicephalobus sp. NKZ332]
MEYFDDEHSSFEHIDEDDFVNNTYQGYCKALFPQQINFNEVWDRLKEVVDGILKEQKIEKEKWDAAFLDVYQLCGALPKALSDELYRALEARIVEHVVGIKEQLATLGRGRHFLEELMRYHGIMQNVSFHFNNVFRHLNNYISHQSRDLAINEVVSNQRRNYHISPKCHIGKLTMTIWKDRVLIHFSHKICKLMLEQFEAHRLGKPVDLVDLLHDAIACYIAVEDPIPEFLSPTIPYRQQKENEFQFYRKTFEIPLKELCESFYEKKSKAWAKIEDKIELIENVADLIENDKELTKKIMHPSTVTATEQWAAEILVADKVKNSFLSFKSRMNKEKFDAESLKKCFQVLKLIDEGIYPLVNDFENYIIEVTGDKLGDQFSDPKVFVNAVAEANNHFKEIVGNVFSGNSDFQQAMYKGLKILVNQPGSNIRAGDRLARYADVMLRKSKDKEKEAEERSQENLILVLGYLIDKEQFEKPYQVLLANRLLGKISSGAVAEEQMIEALRQVCSSDALQKFTRMCYDIKQSLTEKNNFYKQSGKEKSCFPIEFYVLQTGAWPLQQVSESFNYPSEVKESMMEFENYYVGAHNGRTLTWNSSISTLDVEFTYLDKPYVVTMTTVHFEILSAFENEDSLQVGQLSARISMTLDSAKKYLKAFLDNQIFVCGVKLDEIEESTRIMLNLKMTRKTNRFRLGIPLTNKTVKQEIRPEVADAQNNQKHYIDCVIVRIMKMKKTVKHNELVADVINEVKNRFLPSTTLIKSCIESLIQRAYIKRTEEISVYEYIS